MKNMIIIAIDLLGLEVKDLEWYQMCTRTIIVFFIALIFFRVSGMRTFGTQSAFDVIVSLTLGAILSRCITGHYPFFSCLSAATLLVILHQVIAFLTYRSKKIRKIAEGQAIILFEDGKKVEKNLSEYSIIDTELQQALHQANVDSYDKVKAIWLEPSGNISVVKKES
jgi:uncharacterized membrane protein YcaP (DUF421 family)